MKLNIKLTSGLKFSTEFAGETVRECKQHLTEEHSCAVPSRQRLVYKGRILDDAKKLKEDYEIVDGSTLFLVAIQEPAAAAAAAPSNSNTTATANNNNNTAATATTQTTTTASTSTTPSLDMNRLIQQMTQMQTPSPALRPPVPPANSNRTSAANNDPFSSLQSNPLLQNLMNDNPEFLANMMQSQLENNPALRRLMDENPVLREALSDPAALREMMQSWNNPELRAQQQRHHDLALANIENMPGGFNMLRNLYETVQVPMEEAASASTIPSSSTSNTNISNTNNASAATSDATAGATNQAMPNPWGSPRSAPSSTNAMMTMDNPFAAMGSGTNPFAMGANPFPMGANPFAAMGAIDPLAIGGVGQQQQPSREQQEAAIAMLEGNPALQQMISASIRQNPGMIRQFMQNGNPAAAAMMNNMSDEELTSMMEMVTNPAAMRGILRMQEQMQNNTNGMPNPMDILSLMGGTSMGTGGANPFLAGNPFLATAAAAAGSNPWASSASSSQRQPQPLQPPAIRYARQLEQIRNMGFDDEVAALSALERANGNLNRAVDILLESTSSGEPTTTTNS